MEDGYSKAMRVDAPELIKPSEESEIMRGQ